MIKLVSGLAGLGPPDSVLCLFVLGHTAVARNEDPRDLIYGMLLLALIGIPHLSGIPSRGSRSRGVQEASRRRREG